MEKLTILSEKTRKTLIILSSFMLVILMLLLVQVTESEPFSLDEIYYSSSEFIDINHRQLSTLEKEQANFIVFVYQEGCPISSELKTHLDELILSNSLTFYKTEVSNINNTKMDGVVKHCPSIVIYQNGKVVTYLNPYSDKDSPIIQSVKDLEEWLGRYVMIQR